MIPAKMFHFQKNQVGLKKGLEIFNRSTAYLPLRVAAAHHLDKNDSHTEEHLSSAASIVISLSLSLCSFAALTGNVVIS